MIGVDKTAPPAAAIVAIPLMRCAATQRIGTPRPSPVESLIELSHQMSPCTKRRVDKELIGGLTEVPGTKGPDEAWR